MGNIKHIIDKQKSDWLINLKKNYYSQAGEDGIINEIFQIIPDTDKWCVEVGAWDGKFLSNTAFLVENHNYHCVFFEYNVKKFNELKNNYVGNERIYTFNKKVGIGINNGLDSLLKKIKIPKNFDLLSIDVDGNDYHIWNNVHKYKPKVVIIEYNPSIPSEVDFIQEPVEDIAHGSSLLSIVKLGKEKGYELISVTRVNAILVSKEYFSLFGIKDNSLEKLRKDSRYITHIFCGYDGQVFLSGYKKIPWHGLELREKKIQEVPNIFRGFPPDYGKIKLVIWGFFVFLKRFKADPTSTTKSIYLKYFR